jgi:hypothetical protein
MYVSICTIVDGLVTRPPMPDDVFTANALVWQREQQNTENKTNTHYDNCDDDNNDGFEPMDCDDQQNHYNDNNNPFDSQPPVRL